MVQLIPVFYLEQWPLPNVLEEDARKKKMQDVLILYINI